MPIYEFKCKKCGRIFDALCMKEGEKEQIRCMYCGNDELEELLSTFSSACSAPDGFS